MSVMEDSTCTKDMRPNQFEFSNDGSNVIGRTRKGEVFLFDRSDWDIVKKHTWYISKRGYVTTNIKRVPTPMHKILLGKIEGRDTDHISRDKLDNRRSNLRICTHQENSFNQPLRSTNTTGYIGVSFVKAAKKFEAYVHFNGRKHYFGLYDHSRDAAVARDNGAKLLFGEFANLNFSSQAM